MSRIVSLLGGLVFLAIAAVALYRLLFWFPISIGGHEIGQTASFLTCAAAAGLALMFFFGNRSVVR
jgi:high-affinity Fe2+/Pb2+ permease